MTRRVAIVDSPTHSGAAVCSGTDADPTDDPGDVAGIVQAPMMLALKVQAEMTQGLGNPELFPQVHRPRELCLEIQVLRAKRVTQPVVFAVLDELVPVVIAPRAE